MVTITDSLSKKRITPINEFELPCGLGTFTTLAFRSLCELTKETSSPAYNLGVIAEAKGRLGSELVHRKR
jgi:hypothetical protein